MTKELENNYKNVKTIVFIFIVEIPYMDGFSPGNTGLIKPIGKTQDYFLCVSYARLSVGKQDWREEQSMRVERRTPESLQLY